VNSNPFQLLKGIPLLALILCACAGTQQEPALPNAGRTLKPDPRELSIIRSLACSADGSMVAAGGEDYALSIWDTEQGTRLQRIEGGQPERCRSLAFTKEGLLVSAVPAGLLLRDPRKPDPTRTLTMSPFPARFALAKCGERAATAGSSGVRMIEISTGKDLGRFAGRLTDPGSLAIDDTGTRVFFVDERDTIRSWDLDKNGEASWRFPEETFKSIALAAEGARLIAAGMKGRILEIDVADGKVLRTWTLEPLGGKPAHVLAVAVLPSQHLFVAGGYDGALHFWDLISGKSIGVQAGAHRGWVTALAVSTDGRRLISGGEDGILRTWSWDARPK
jgi:WD40 repeat protein